LFYSPPENYSRAAKDKKIMSESATAPNYIELCADIVSAYVSNNSVPAADLPVLLNSVYAALTKTAQGHS
jgi:predicted transcriptional regulator